MRGGTPVSTPYRFTGQREEEALGLYYYGARWYDPELRRFIQPDTIVPQPGNPQSLNRYSYVLNNPVRYTDPTGQIWQEEQVPAQTIVDELADYGVSINKDWGWIVVKIGQSDPKRFWRLGSWELNELEAVRDAVQDLGRKLGGPAAFRERIGRVRIKRYKGLSTTSIWVSSKRYAHSLWNTVTLFDECFYHPYIKDGEPNPRAVVVHETAHVWDANPGEWGSELIGDVVKREQRPTDNSYTNPREHWADTVETNVYRGMPSERHWGPWHEQYMALAVRGWRGRVSGPASP